MSELDSDAEITRREFVGYAGVPVALSLGMPMNVQAAPTTRQTSAGALTVRLTVNDVDRSLTIDPRVTLLDAVRDHLALTGTKKGCDQGTCGACTVLVNGRRIVSCLTLAAMHEGDRITTIEGIARGDALHPVQAAFIKHDGSNAATARPAKSFRPSE